MRFPARFPWRLPGDAAPVVTPGPPLLLRVTCTRALTAPVRVGLEVARVQSHRSLRAEVRA